MHRSSDPKRTAISQWLTSNLPWHGCYGGERYIAMGVLSVYSITLHLHPMFRVSRVGQFCFITAISLQVHWPCSYSYATTPGHYHNYFQLNSVQWAPLIWVSSTIVTMCSKYTLLTVSNTISNVAPTSVDKLTGKPLTCRSYSYIQLHTLVQLDINYRPVSQLSLWNS